MARWRSCQRRVRALMPTTCKSNRNNLTNNSNITPKLKLKKESTHSQREKRSRMWIRFCRGHWCNVGFSIANGNLLVSLSSFRSLSLSLAHSAYRCHYICWVYFVKNPFWLERRVRPKTNSTRGVKKNYHIFIYYWTLIRETFVSCVKKKTKNKQNKKHTIELNVSIYECRVSLSLCVCGSEHRRESDLSRAPSHSRSRSSCTIRLNRFDQEINEYINTFLHRRFGIFSLAFSWAEVRKCISHVIALYGIVRKPSGKKVCQQK